MAPLIARRPLNIKILRPLSGNKGSWQLQPRLGGKEGTQSSVSSLCYVTDAPIVVSADLLAAQEFTAKVRQGRTRLQDLRLHGQLSIGLGTFGDARKVSLAGGLCLRLRWPQ